MYRILFSLGCVASLYLSPARAAEGNLPNMPVYKPNAPVYKPNAPVYKPNAPVYKPNMYHASKPFNKPTYAKPFNKPTSTKPVNVRNNGFRRTNHGYKVTTGINTNVQRNRTNALPNVP